MGGGRAYVGVGEGANVRGGDVIARVDNADYQAAISQAQANIASAEANAIEARADRDQLAKEASRVRDIRAKNANLISQQDLDLATSRVAQAEARLNSAEARRRSADAALSMAQATFDNTIIRAPFSGTVLRKDAEVGEVVAPSVGGGPTRGAGGTLASSAT